MHQRFEIILFNYHSIKDQFVHNSTHRSSINIFINSPFFMSTQWSKIFITITNTEIQYFPKKNIVHYICGCLKRCAPLIFWSHCIFNIMKALEYCEGPAVYKFKFCPLSLSFKFKIHPSTAQRWANLVVVYIFIRIYTISRSMVKVTISYIYSDFKN